MISTSTLKKNKSKAKAVATAKTNAEPLAASNGSTPFKLMLQGGHPNSLGNTLAVVDIVFTDPKRLDELFECYFNDDDLVRVRTSNALKRISKEQPTWMLPYINRLFSEVTDLREASTQWTIAQLCLSLNRYLSDSQRVKAIDILKYNLTHYTDWIVLNTSMQALTQWAKSDKDLRIWLMPHLQMLAHDSRKSVCSKAYKLHKSLRKLCG